MCVLIENEESIVATDKNWQRDVFALATNAGELVGSLPIVGLTRLHGDLTDTTGELSYRVQGKIDARKHSMLHIEITGSLTMVCQRCLESVVQAVDVSNVLQLVASDAELDSEEAELEAILAGDTSPEKIVGSKEFELHDLLEDEVILGLPMVVAHAVCDEVLPTESGQKTSPFDALAQLKQ